MLRFQRCADCGEEIPGNMDGVACMGMPTGMVYRRSDGSVAHRCADVSEADVAVAVSRARG